MTGPTTPTRLPGEPIPPPPEPRYPWKVGLTMVGLVVLVVAVVSLAFQFVKGPSTAAEYPTAPTLTVYAQYFGATATVAEAAHRTAVAQQQPATQQPVQATRAPVALPAPTAAPAATPQVATTVPAGAPEPATTAAPAAATSAATPGPTQAPAAASQAEPARIATLAPVGGAASASESPVPTVAPDLEQAVVAAYNQYWQVKADAFFLLDASHLSEVATGPELARLQQRISDDQANGRATRIRVLHDFVVVAADDHQAKVADDYRDLSLWIDPSTHQPLPGQTEPASPDAAPEHKVVVDLQLSDGVWKVADGVELVSQEAAQ